MLRLLFCLPICKGLAFLLALMILYIPDTLWGQHKSTDPVFETKISLNMEGISLESLLSEITAKYQIEFSYSSTIIDVKRKISLDVHEQSLKLVLQTVFEGYPVTYSAIKSRIVFQKNKEPLVQTVKGKVIDIGSKAPVAGAAVFIMDSEGALGAVTNDDGIFKIENVPIGRQSIFTSHISYKPFQILSFLVVSGKENVFFIEMTEAEALLEEVIISGDKENHNFEQALSHISMQPLNISEAKRHAASLNDPARMVSSAPGVAGDDFMENSIVIRGNSSRGLLWRVEGIDIPNPNHFAEEGASGGGVSIINSHMLDQSYLLTGAFPSRYGNALSGVLDLRLRNGNNEKREHYIQAGTMGLDMATEGPFVKGKAASYLINYRYSSFSLLDRAGFNFSPANSTTRFQDMAFKINLPIQKAGEFSLFGIGGASIYKTDSVGVNGASHSSMGILGLIHTLQLNHTTSIRSNYSYSGTSIKQLRDYHLGSPSSYQYQENFGKSYSRASATLYKKINFRHNLEAGFMYSRLMYNFRDNVHEENAGQPSRSFFYFDDQGFAGLTQAYVSAQSKLGKRWQLENGLHFMHFSLNGKSSVEPRTSLSFQLLPNQSIYAAFGIHSKIEPLQYYFARFTTPDQQQIQYNRELDFTKARHFVLGYDNHLRPDLLFKVEAYYQGMYNIAIRNDSSSIFSSISVYGSTFTNYELLSHGTGTNYGVEASLEKSFGKNYYFHINGAMLNATYVTGDLMERNTPYNSSFNSNFIAGKAFDVGSRKNEKTLSFNCRAAWRGGKRYIPADLEKSRAAGREILNLQEAYQHQFADYKRLDVQLVYRFNLVRYTGEWKLDVFNVTNHQSVTRLFYDVESQEIKDNVQLGMYPVLSYKMEF